MNLPNVTVPGILSRLIKSFICLSLLQLLFSIHASCQGFQNINIDALRKSVVFISVPCDITNASNSACVNGLFPDGTGFLVAVPHKPNGVYLLLVTARHMVDPAWMHCNEGVPTAFHVFLNKQEYDPSSGASGTIEVTIPNTPGTWRFPSDDSADVAVTSLNGNYLESFGVEKGAISFQICRRPGDPKDPHRRSGHIRRNVSWRIRIHAKLSRVQVRLCVASIPGEKINSACCPTCIRPLSEWLIAANLVPGNSR